MVQDVSHFLLLNMGSHFALKEVVENALGRLTKRSQMKNPVVANFTPLVQLPQQRGRFTNREL